MRAVDARRGLQLALAGLWLLDGVLQFQPFMFTAGFARQVMAPGAQGNPALIADPITSVARLVADHPAATNAAFATIQVLLGLAIAWRPTVKAALAVSVVWALGVWWLGEGLGGVLTGQAGPVAGGPGAALLYALLAVLLWPPREDALRREPFVGAGLIGATPARLVWFVLWGSLAGYAVDRTNRSPQALHNLLAGMSAGQPTWIAAISNHSASVVAHRGLGVSVALAAVLAGVALSVFGKPALARTAVVVATLVSAVIWVTAEALGGLFGGQGTDPNTGPLLMVIALAYWPLAQRGASRGGGSARP
jgi:hypothetical protein